MPLSWLYRIQSFSKIEDLPRAVSYLHTWVVKNGFVLDFLREASELKNVTKSGKNPHSSKRPSW